MAVTDELEGGADPSESRELLALCLKRVNGLAKVAGNGLDGLRSGVGDLGQSCKSCHDEFRQKE